MLSRNLCKSSLHRGASCSKVPNVSFAGIDPSCATMSRSLVLWVWGAGGLAAGKVLWALLFCLWASIGIAFGILQFPGSSSHLIWGERSSVPWSALHGTRSCGICALLLPGRQMSTATAEIVYGHLAAYWNLVRWLFKAGFYTVSPCKMLSSGWTLCSLIGAISRLVTHIAAFVASYGRSSVIGCPLSLPTRSVNLRLVLCQMQLQVPKSLCHFFQADVFFRLSLALLLQGLQLMRGIGAVFGLPEIMQPLLHYLGLLDRC